MFISYKQQFATPATLIDHILLQSSYLGINISNNNNSLLNIPIV